MFIIRSVDPLFHVPEAFVTVIPAPDGLPSDQTRFGVVANGSNGWLCMFQTSPALPTAAGPTATGVTVIFPKSTFRICWALETTSMAIKADGNRPFSRIGLVMFRGGGGRSIRSFVEGHK
jgi:hypothetical protein